MGRRKKLQNVVKVDLEEVAFEKGEAFPIRVQQLSKDGRRMEETVHKVPTPQIRPPAPAFDPSPAYGMGQDWPSLGVCDATAAGGTNDPERVCPHFFCRDPSNVASSCS